MTSEAVERDEESRDLEAAQAELAALFATAKFQFVVSDFLRTEVGRYLVARADTEIESCLQELAKADPEEPKAIRELQTRIRVASSWQDWLATAITEGNLAHQELINRGD